MTPLAEQGDADAQNSLGVMYNMGWGVPQDYKKSVYWLQKSAWQENAKAQYSLGHMYADGHGVSQNLERTFYWWARSIANGDFISQAMINLKIYANQSNQYAQYKLGEIYQYGQGVPQDLEKAFYWYYKANENGHTDAKIKLEYIKLKIK